MGMAALALDQLLEYIRDLGERHPDVKTSVMSLPEQFKPPGVELYPVVIIEPDPMATEVNPAQDEWQLALQVLVRPVRSDDKPNPALVATAKSIADDIRQQIEDERHIKLSSKPDFVLMYNDADTAKSSGVRMGFAVRVEKMQERNANQAKFKPRA
jgi:hypothetical protein